MRSDDHEDTHGKEHMQNMMEGMTDSLTTPDYTEKKETLVKQAYKAQFDG